MTTRDERFQMDDDLEVLATADEVAEMRARVAAGEDPQAVAEEISVRGLEVPEDDGPTTAAAAKEGRLHAAADRSAPRISVALRHAFLEGRKALGRSFQNANPDEAANDAAVAVAKALATTLKPALADALVAGGDAAISMLPVGLRLAKDGDAEPRFRFRFDKANPAAAEWAKEHAAELVKGIAETTRAKVRLAIEEFQADGEAAGDWEFARDRILAAVGDEDRANLIARHESMLSAGEGQRQAWDQAVDEGLLTGEETRTWIAVGDEKVCPVCEALDGETVPLGLPYVTGDGEFDGPPAHVACRCTEGLAS